MRHNRLIMKDRKLLLVAFLLSTTNYPLSTCLAQGDLTPPGPPAPTMKSLAQIEPRTPISSLPFVIGTGGSYYLTDNLTGVPGQDGISVGADNVTIDLGGFQLVGVTGASSGIAASSVRTNVVVRNGTVRDWPLFGVGTGNMVGGRYERLQLVRNGSGGLNVGNGSLALECVVVRSPTTGVSIGAITTGTASAVRNCVVKNSAGIGIQVGGGSTVSGCTVEATGGVSISAGVGCNVAGCVVNSGFGVAIKIARRG